MKGNRNLRKLAALLLVAVMAVLAAGPAPAMADKGNRDPSIVPLQDSYAGYTYGEWSNMWWQWAFAQPVDPNDVNIHPVYDPTGEQCAVGQSGPVWFLAGNFTPGKYVRNCTIPADKALFVPISNIEDDTSWEEGRTPEEVDQWVEDNFDPTIPMTFKIDGRHVSNLTDYLVPTDNPPGELYLPSFDPPLLNVEQYWFGYMPAVGGPYYIRTAGYYLMLEPLSAGQHTIKFTADFVGGALDVTYHLTVEPDPGTVVPIDDRYDGKSYGQLSDMWWQWVTDVPIDPENLDLHPMFDRTGERCGVGQSGSVWFLAGNQYPGPLTRECTVPAGTALFVPLINIEEDTSHYPDPHSPVNRAAVDNYVAEMVSIMRTEPEWLWATIDGSLVENISAYLVPADNPPYRIAVRDFEPPLLNLEQYWYGDVPAGSYYARSAGYYLLVTPFTPGEHTIHFFAAAGYPEPFFTLDVTYDLNVVR